MKKTRLRFALITLDEGGSRSMTVRCLLVLTLTLLVSGLAWAQIVSETKLLASNGEAGDEFGWSASVSGDTALIGAPRDDDNGDNSGSAYVYERSGEVWTEQALLASDGEAGDAFGWSASISGDTAVVGAAGLGNSAYVFVRSGGVWTEQAKLLASDGARSSDFLWRQSVSVSPGIPPCSRG